MSSSSSSNVKLIHCLTCGNGFVCSGPLADQRKYCVQCILVRPFTGGLTERKIKALAMVIDPEHANDLFAPYHNEYRCRDCREYLSGVCNASRCDACFGWLCGKCPRKNDFLGMSTEVYCLSCENSTSKKSE